MAQQDFSKYEKARILGARALQISMDASILTKLSEADLEKLNYDPLRIAERELELDVLPITVKRPLPGKREKDIDKVKIEVKKDVVKEGEAEKTEEEIKKIAEEGEIMELANPEDERDSDSGNGSA